MIFLISLCIALLFVILCSNLLIKKPTPFYVGAAIIGIASVVMTWSDFDMPAIVNDWVLPIIARGGLTGALFVIVMYAGAFPSRSLGAKIFMPIRGPISIIASILGIGHGIAYSKQYINMVVNGSGNLDVATIVFIIDSVVMSLLMIPLFITSFKAVRKRMNGKTWKSLQKSAYIFYFLLFIHVMLLMVPRALKGEMGYDLTVFVYGFVFISYFLCRVIKAVNKSNLEIIPKKQIVAMATALFLATLAVAVIMNTSTVNAKDENIKTKAGASGSSGSTVDLEDGTYNGEAMGNNGNIVVNVTVKDGAITDIVITKFVDDKEFFDKDIDGKILIDEVIENQSTDVDGISGATYSSKGFLGAVDDALEKAK